jgi:exodeoxyribonuclease VII small subunit
LKELKFEDAMIKLEGEVKKLESGNMTLDESIASFEEAVKLIGVCNKQLENAERRVRLLTETTDGSITDVPFDINDET